MGSPDSRSRSTPIFMHPRHGGNKRLCIGMQRMREHLRGGPGFDDLSEIHDQHPVAQQPHDGKVVRNEQIAHAELALEPLQELQNDHLHRNVERGGRLVEHEKLGLDRNGAGDADAGALPAGKLMRETR